MSRVVQVGSAELRRGLRGRWWLYIITTNGLKYALLSYTMVEIPDPGCLIKLRRPVLTEVPKPYRQDSDILTYFDSPTVNNNEGVLTLEEIL